MTKEKILNVAFELFTTRSYSAVTMDDIAKAADVSKGGVFHYFSSKYELARECLFHSLGSMNGQGFSGELEKAKALETAREMIGFYVDMVKDNPKMMKFFLEVYEQAVNIEDAAVWEDFYKRYLDEMVQLMSACNVKDPQNKAVLLLGTLDALGLQSVLMPDMSFPWDDLKDEIFRIYIEDQIEEK